MRKIVFIGGGDVESNATLPKCFYFAKAAKDRGFEVEINVQGTNGNRRLAEKLNLLANCKWRAVAGAIAQSIEAIFLGISTKDAVIIVIGISIRNIPLLGSRSKLVFDYDEYLPSHEGLTVGRKLTYEIVERYTRIIGGAFIVASAKLEEKTRRYARRRLVKIHYSPIGIDPDDLQALPEQTLRKSKSVLTWMGTLDRRYSIDELLKLGMMLKELGLNHKINIKVIGGGPDSEWFQSQLTRAGISDTVVMTGKVSRFEIGKFLTDADAFLLPLPPTPQNEYRCPTKAFQYGYLRRPLVTNRTGEVYRLFGENAHYYKPGDISDMLKQAMEALRKAKLLPEVSRLELEWSCRSRKAVDFIEALMR